jgi:hypothetical protein
VISWFQAFAFKRALDRYQPERRIRGELADMEVWMRDHLNTMAAAVCARSQAPAVYGKDLLLRSFRRADITRTGRVGTFHTTLFCSQNTS